MSSGARLPTPSSHAQALRQAMLTVMDGPGYVDGGKTLFTYAHPVFWAPLVRRHVTQHLLDRGLGVAGVAIDPAAS